MKFEVGSRLVNKLNNKEVIVVDINNVWSYMSYSVYEPLTQKVYNLNAEDLTDKRYTNINSDDIFVWAISARIRHELSRRRVSTLSPNVLPLPHQTYVLNRVLEKDEIRYILADEVGLGKTIEAGLIIQELKARGLIKRTLVVCPTGLINQWQQEMMDKFNQDFKVLMPSNFDLVRNITGKENIFEEFPNVITSMDSIKPLETRLHWSEEKIQAYNDERIGSILEGQWDLIIIDEAHRVAGSSSDVARHRLGKLLAEASPYLLLLTATPHNGKSEPFLRLLRLLDKDLFPNIEAINKAQVSPFVIRTEKREAIDNNGNLLFKKRNTNILELNWTESSSMQKKLYEEVSSYISNEYRKTRRGKSNNPLYIFLLIMMQRMVTSSTAAIRSSLEKRIKFIEKNENIINTSSRYMELGTIDENDLEEALKIREDYTNEDIDIMKNLLELSKQAEYQAVDIKLDKLDFLLENIKSKNPKRKIIIFTEFVATQELLKSFLEDKGYGISIINGSLNREDRDIEINNFRAYNDFLVSTDAGGEGLNLQFANCVINYDLPWNPMKIEQRIGRVDRIGQKSDVDIYNFIIEDTVESRVREVLESKLFKIFEELGIDKYSDILDGEIADVDFTKLYMESLRVPKNIENFIKPIEDNIKYEIEESKKVKELINTDKKLNLINEEDSFDIKTALNELIISDSVNLCKLNINGNQELSNKDIFLITNNKQEVNFDQIPVVGFNNFNYESGYFAIWNIKVSDEDTLGNMFPIFINDELKLRPLAGKNIWNYLQNSKNVVELNSTITIGCSIRKEIFKISEEFSKGKFIECKEIFLKRIREDRKKKEYALNIRLESAKNIGIESIRNAKIKSIMSEMDNLNKKFHKKEKITPIFNLVMLLRMETTHNETS